MVTDKLGSKRAIRESILTEDTKDFLEFLEKRYTPHIWFYKISDRFTSGLPDYGGVAFGTPFYMELKRENKEPRKLQEYMLRRIQRAGGKAGSFNRFVDVKRFLLALIPIR